MASNGNSGSATGASGSPSSGGVRTLKRGELLFKEGEKAQFLYLIQSGSASAQLLRAKPIELFAVVQGSLVGEHALMGVAFNPFSMVATQDLKALELPVDAVKSQLDGLQGVQKICVKSMLDRLKLFQSEIKSIRLEKDSSACPPDQLAKIFGTLFLIAKSKGEAQSNGNISIDWLSARQYGQRVLLESPKRLEQLGDLMVKMNMGEWIMQKDPDLADDPSAPLEKYKLVLRDLSVLEDTLEHWQYYFFKGGKLEFLKTEEKVMQVVAALAEYSKAIEPDRNGRALFDYSVFIERYRTEFGISLNADIFSLIEQKGVSILRKTFEIDGKSIVRLQFEPRELTRWSRIWTVLKEVERWNEKGYVDLSEPGYDPLRKHAPQSKSLLTIDCPSCKAALEGNPKFCSQCGHKLVNAA